MPAFFFRLWLYPHDPPEIETWYQGLEPTEPDKRSVAEWAKEALQYEDLYDRLELNKNHAYQVVGKATIEGDYNPWTQEHDQEINFLEFEYEKLKYDSEDDQPVITVTAGYLLDSGLWMKMKMSPARYQEIKNGIQAVVDHLGQERVEESIKFNGLTSTMWHLFKLVWFDFQADDDHPLYNVSQSYRRTRILPFKDRCWLSNLYKEVNDDHITTALKRIAKELNLGPADASETKSKRNLAK